MGKLAAFLPNKRYRDAKTYVHSYVRTYVDKAVALQASNFSSEPPKATDSSRYIFLEQLAKSGYSAQKIQAELLNILLAGRDTTASLLTVLFVTLSQHPDTLEKLRQEVAQLEGRYPTFEEIKDMKYLKWCINESKISHHSFPIVIFRSKTTRKNNFILIPLPAMRLHPIVPASSRYAARDTILPRGGGPDEKSPILVKKGTTVLFSSYTLHRRTDIYGEDAHLFRPERWENLKVGYVVSTFLSLDFRFWMGREH